MGIKERQERDREAVRRAILDAARDLFVSEGYDNVSIRKIAERIEYSPAAIYGYFPSKDDIFFALAEEGFRLLGDPGVGEAHERLQNLPPLERVRAVFWRLYEFSRQQPAQPQQASLRGQRVGRGNCPTLAHLRQALHRPNIMLVSKPPKKTFPQ